MRLAETREALFGEILSRNERRLAAIARSYARGEEWRDLYQDILLQIWKSLGGFAGRSAPDTWVYRVALNTAVSHSRRAAVRRSEGTAGGEEPGRAHERSPLAILEEFIASLASVDRAVFLLYLEDLTYRQMSEVLGISENALGVRISRIKKAFIARYGGESTARTGGARPGG